MRNDLERIREALQFIDPSDRETWVIMGMATHAELGDAGFDLWDDWSQQAESYNASSARDVWKSFRPGGKVTIGTLFHEAKVKGWRDDSSYQRPSPEELAERKRIAAERAAKEEAEIARERAATARKAAAIRKAASEVKPDNPYLSRKQVSPVANLYEIDANAAASILGYQPKSGGEPLTGRLLVVPVKQGNRLSTLELIDGDKRKVSLAGRGSKVGGYWSTERLPKGDGNGLTVLIGEGVATVLSASAATGHPAIASLSSGNLPVVAKAMRKRYPAAVIIILADLVKSTGAPDPHAIDAARSVGGKMAIPDFGANRDPDTTDFNDMAVICGMETIAKVIVKAGAPAAASPKQANDIAAQKPQYSMESDGLWFREPKKGYISEIWICAPFSVKYRARGVDGMGWRFVVLITDRDGVQRELTILDADIGTQDGIWHRTLADAGLKIDPSYRRHLGKYLLLQCDGAPRAISTETAGLLRDCYVLHARTIGRSAEPIIYVGADRNNVFVENGTLESWRGQIGRYCAGNSRLVLSVCMALAAPLLPLSDISESGGVHLFGASADGKTSTAQVAASCYGNPLEYMTTWRNTSNATEGTAAKFNHFLLILDEIREASERDLQPTIMMLGNGGGKMRMRDNATLRDRLTWLILWLSTGEYSTEHYLEAAGIKGDPGLAARQNDIPSDAGAGMGVFECLHDHPTPRALAEHLQSATRKCHGAIGIAWLEHITSHIEQIRVELPEMIDHMLREFAADHQGAESQVLRAMRRFALIAVSGELATKAGLTGWKLGEATSAVRKCVKAWLDQRGGAENLEQRRIMERLRDYIGRNWQGRFIPWGRAGDEHAPAKSEAVGFRRDAQISVGTDQAVPGTEFYITPEGWNEIFRGLDPARAGQVLMARGVLVPGDWKRAGKQEQRPYTRVTLPTQGRRQCYHVRAGVFELLGDMQEDE